MNKHFRKCIFSKDILSFFFNIVVLIFILCANFSYAGVEIKTISPEPKKINGKSFKNTHLVDGKTDSSRMWVSAGSAFWVQSAPITIEMDVDPIRDGDSNMAGLIKIHTAERESSGIRLLKRVDVYGQSDLDKQFHIGSWQKEEGIKKKSLIGDDIWIAVPIVGGFKKYTLVLHGEGRFVTLDEISLTYSDNATGKKERVSQSPLDDSLARISLGHALRYPVKKIIDGDSKLSISEINPWVDALDNNEGEGVSSIVFLESENSKIFRIANHSSDSLCLDLSVNKGYGYYWVEQVISTDGKRIYDPLVPIDDCRLLEKLDYVYLWIERTASDKNNSGDLNFFTENEVLLSVGLESQPKDKVIEQCFDVNIWAYQNELPIWQNKQAAYELLIGSGNNVFFVPPSMLPAINPSGLKSKNWDRLKKYVGLYTQNDSQILIYMGLTKKIKNWEAYFSTIADDELKQWLDQLQAVMAYSGFDNADWALYPFDEINAKKVDSFLDFSKRIKHANDEVRIFSNPVYSGSKSAALSSDEIKKIVVMSDIVQPSLKLYKNSVSEVFISPGTEFWVYDNPSFPAKSESLSFYKELPQQAKKIGATGVGFWSFSDTKKSSAWSDVDGQRPDWAVVYDYQDGIISSRRWAAFKEGLKIACE